MTTTTTTRKATEILDAYFEASRVYRDAFAAGGPCLVELSRLDAAKDEVVELICENNMTDIYHRGRLFHVGDRYVLKATNIPTAGELDAKEAPR